LVRSGRGAPELPGSAPRLKFAYTLPNFVDPAAGQFAGKPMMIYHRRIKEMMSLYRVSDDLDADHDVLVSAVRSDLIEGGRLEAVLDELEQRLREAAIEDRTVYAVRNIVIELAGNIRLHGAGSRSEPELLVVNRRGSDVQVWLFGYGRPENVDRLSGIIRDIKAIASPPNHREILLERRNQDLLRRAEPSKVYGGGVGMLTVAALSSQPLWFKLSRTKEVSSFALRSTVQASA
jgi:hypothetical protein